MDDLHLPDEIHPITIDDESKEDQSPTLIQSETQPPPIEVEFQVGEATPVANKNQVFDGQIGFASWDTAWMRLQDFHERALGLGGPFETQIANELTSDGAFKAYSNAATLLLAQFIVSEPAMQIDMLNSVGQFADETGSLKGLETFFLSGVRAAQLQGDFQALDAAAGVLGQTGFPSEWSGGVEYASLYDIGTNQLGFANRDQVQQGFGSFGPSLFHSPGSSDVPSQGSDFLTSASREIFNGIEGFFRGNSTSTSQGPAPAPGSVEASEQEGLKFAKFGGELGASIGIIAGGIAGAVSGGLAGSAIGFLVGAVVGLFKSDTPAVEHPAPSTPAHGERPAQPTTPGPGRHPSQPGAHPSGPGQPPASSGGGAHKCWEPDMETGLPAFEGEGGGGRNDEGVNWMPTWIVQGPAIEGLAVHIGGDRFQFHNLPQFDHQGRLLRAGFLANLDFVIQPPGDGLNNAHLGEIPGSIQALQDTIDSPDPVIPES